MNQVVQEKLLACQKNTALISQKLTILKESRRPVLEDIDDLPQQNYQPKQLEIPTKEYLKQIEAQHKEINKQVEVINKKAEKIEKKYNREERKRQDEKLFPKRPIIRTKEQIEQERKAKEDKRLDDFINRIVTKYEPYLKKPEPLKEEQIKAQTIYNEKFKQYQMQKQHTNKIEEGLSAKEKKQFDLVTTKDNWMKTQNRKQDSPDLIEDCVVDVKEMEQQQEEINKKIEREKRKKQQQILFYKLLDEKQRMDQTLLKKNFNTLVTKMFRQMDKQKTGYISKEEVLSYLKEYQIFIDIFEINWQPFKEFVIKVKATRKGLLNKVELIEILQDKKLHSKPQDVIERIKQQKRENYELPEFEVEQVVQKEEEVEVVKQQDRDPEIDYRQFEELTQLNSEYQDTYYPIYHQNLEEKRIECEKIEKNKQKTEKRKLDPNFIAFNNEIGQLQEQYNKGNLEFQKSEEFIIDSKLYQ